MDGAICAGRQGCAKNLGVALTADGNRNNFSAMLLFKSQRFFESVIVGLTLPRDSNPDL
jgi:hypothetical protein